MTPRKRIYVLLITLVSLFLTACGGSNNSTESAANTKSTFDVASAGINSNLAISNTGSYEEETPYENEDIELDLESNNEDDTNTDNNTNSEQNTLLKEDKLVYRCEIDIETLDFNNSYNEIQSLIETNNARIERETFEDNTKNIELYGIYNYKYLKTSQIIIRVPSEKYKQLINYEFDKEKALITRKNTSIENITQRYYDTTSEVQGLKIQEERLLQLLEKATEVDDMIELNKEITNVQNRINELQTQIITMDMDTIYSYVTINLKETIELTPEKELIKTNTFLDRLKNTCIDTWRNVKNSLEILLFFIINVSPLLLLIAILIIIFRKKIIKYKNSKVSLKDIDTLIKQAEDADKTEENK